MCLLQVALAEYARKMNIRHNHAVVKPGNANELNDPKRSQAVSQLTQTQSKKQTMT